MVSKSKMISWLKDQKTDMDLYDPRSDMDDGDHGMGAWSLSAKKEENNKMIDEIIKKLKDK